MRGLLEGDRLDLRVGFLPLDQIHAQVLALHADQFGVAVVAYAVGREDRGRVAGAERLEAVEVFAERGGDVREEQFAVDIHLRHEHLRVDVLLDIGVEPAREFLDVLGSHRQPGGIHMPAEVLQQIRARLHGLVKVEARYRACRSCHEAVAHRQHHRRPVVGLDQARGDDSHDALHPLGIVDHRALQLFHCGVALDKIVRFLRHRTVDRLAILVVGVDDVPELRGDAFVAFDQQLDGRVPARGRGVFVVLVHPHAPGGVDTRPDLEDDVVDGDVVLVQAADLDDRQQSFRRFAVEIFQPEMGKDTVFAHQGYDIRSDAHDQQV